MYFNMAATEALPNRLDRLEQKIDDLAEKLDKPTTRRKWLDTAQALEMMNVTVAYLYSLRKNGLLHAYKVQGKVYYKLEEIEQLLENSRVEAE